MRRVLMISPHFPPDSTAGTHRVRLLAPHLREFGWDPTVLTVDPRDYEGRLDPVLAESVPRDVRVVRARAWSAGATRRFGVGDLGLRAYAGLRREAERLLTLESFDAIFVTIYPTYPAMLGRRLKRLFGLPFILDYQDPWVGEWGASVGPTGGGRPDVRSRASRVVAGRLEPLALRAADAVTAVSRLTYDQAIARVGGVRPGITEELPIGWDAADFAFLRAHRTQPRRWPQDGLLHLVYVGTLLPAGHETLRALLTAIERLRSADPAFARLRLHFFGTSNQRTADAPDRVLPIAREIGVADQVTEAAARLDYFDALAALGDASAVLLLGSRERHYTPSKVFPALASRRPIIAALHEASTATALLRSAGRPPSVRLATYDEIRPAAACVDRIAAMLRGFLADPSFQDDAADWSAIESASARTLASRLAGVFDRTVRRAA